MTQRNRRIHTFSILFGVDYPGPEDAKDRVDEYLAGLEAEDDEELVERGLEEIPSFTETELFEFKKRFGEIIEALPELDRVLLVYCRSGRRSKEAAQKLANMGYTNVYEFCGINEWTGDVE